MAMILFSPPAMHLAPVIVFHFIILAYLFSRKSKSPENWLFTTWMVTITLIVVTQFAGHFVYGAAGAYLVWLGGIGPASLGLVAFLQFAYRYPRRRYDREARIVLGISLLVVVGLWGLMAVEVRQSIVQPPFDSQWVTMTAHPQAAPDLVMRPLAVYNFEQFAYGLLAPRDAQFFTSSNLFDIWQVFAYTWILIVWVRKTIQFSTPDPEVARFRWARALWSPQGQEAQATRAWSLAMLLSPLPVLASILQPRALLPVGSFAVADTITMFVIILTFINYAPEPTSFMIKLVGIALLTLLLILEWTNVTVMNLYQTTYLQARQDDLCYIRELLMAGRPQDAPEAVRYIARRPAETGLFSTQYRLLLTRDPARTAEAFEVNDRTLKACLLQNYVPCVIVVLQENPWLETRMLRPFVYNAEFDRQRAPDATPTYRGGAATPAQHYLRFNLTLDDQVYEIGYSYLDYRRTLHRQALPLFYLTLLSALLLVGGFPILFQVGLVRPLASLLGGVRRVNAGDLSVTAPVFMEDEIGALTHAFNHMVASLRESEAHLRAEVAERARAEAEVRALNVTLEARIADRTRALNTLYDISAAANRTRDIDILLHDSLVCVAPVLEAMSGVVYLLESDTEESTPAHLTLHSSYNLSPALAAQIRTLPAQDGLAGWVCVHKEPLLTADLGADSRATTALRKLEHICLLLAPLLIEGEVVGLIGVGRDAGRLFSHDEVALLLSVAEQVGIAMNNLQLLQQTTVQTERERIARDLHDTAAQSLYGLITLVEAGRVQLDIGDVAAADHFFTRIGETTRQAIKEMRLFIHQLHPPVLEKVGLVEALHQRLATVEGRSSITTRLLADEPVSFSLPVARAFYHIAQEALNNVLKHTHATTVEIVLRQTEAYSILEVVDDGPGFDVAQVSPGRGLQNMHTRAAQLGGICRIISTVGEGTCVRVEIPQTWLTDSPA